jgi:aarF domain-containing kinase
MDATAPIPYPAASSKRVLTMEYLDGVPLADLEGIRKYTASPEATLVSALRTWALSVAINDKFHADVHAGNLLVLEDGRIGFIDFGIGE